MTQRNAMRSGNDDSASAIAAAVKSGQQSATHFVRQALQSLAQVQESNACIYVAADQALAWAERLDQSLKHSTKDLPLAGVPFVVKDNLATRDMPTSGGAASYRSYQPAANATVVQQMIDAGAIPVAKTNLHELAFGITSANAGFGPVLNPFNPLHVAGGSSGGTAVAVAAGVPLGLGTDTGGSIRIPASFCGVYGFRPAARRYSTNGVFTISRTRDTVGTMARSLDDLLLLDAVLTRDSGMSQVVVLEQLRIGFLENFFQDLAPGVERCVTRALDQLREAGATLVPLDGTPLHEWDVNSGFCVSAYEANQEWRRFCTEQLHISFEAFIDTIQSDDVRSIFQFFNSSDMFGQGDYQNAMQWVDAIVRWYDDAFHAHQGLDCIVMPTVPCEPPLLSECDHRLPHEHSAALFGKVSRHASPATLGGVPSVSIPIGHSDPLGLPVGLMCEGPAAGSRRLLAIAKSIEQATGGL